MINLYSLNFSRLRKDLNIVDYYYYLKMKCVSIVFLWSNLFVVRDVNWFFRMKTSSSVLIAG